MHCPNCKVDLEGGLIFDYFAKLYSKEKALDIAAMYGATETEGPLLYYTVVNLQ